MTNRDRQPHDEETARDVPKNTAHVEDMDASSEETQSNEAVAETGRGWRAEDEQREADVPDNGAHVGDLQADADDLEDVLASAADALTDMGAREMRRDQYHRTGGDDLNPGFDSDIDANAPKEDDMPRKKTAGSRGQSDWH